MKQILLLTTLMTLFLIPGLAQGGKELNQLYPVQVNGKYGFINVKGEIVIAPQFDFANEFSEALAAAKIGENFGYIDETGKWVIEPKYKIALPFSEGLAQVRIGGKWTTEPVYLIGGQTSYIDKTGKVVFTLSGSPLGTSYDDYTFSERLLPLAFGEDKYGYLNKTGQVEIKPRFDYAGDFSEGVAAVWVGDYIRFIDKSGKFVMNQKYPIAGWGHPNRFSEGLVSVPMGEKMGFINKTGKVIIAPRFYRADSFSEGLAAIQLTEESEDGYIDKTGKIVIKPQFEIAGHFREGLAAVRINGKWGYIDRTGKILIQPQFYEVKWFLGGLAQVQIDGKLGYIDRTGKAIWKPTK